MGIGASDVGYEAALGKDRVYGLFIWDITSLLDHFIDLGKVVFVLYCIYTYFSALLAFWSMARI